MTTQGKPITVGEDEDEAAVNDACRCLNELTGEWCGSVYPMAILGRYMLRLAAAIVNHEDGEQMAREIFDEAIRQEPTIIHDHEMN